MAYPVRLRIEIYSWWDDLEPIWVAAVGLYIGDLYEYKYADRTLGLHEYKTARAAWSDIDNQLRWYSEYISQTNYDPSGYYKARINGRKLRLKTEGEPIWITTR